MSTNVPITVAHGDGIGPEIMEASLHIIQEAGARIDLGVIEISGEVYLRGNSLGIEPSSWDSLTPQGGGIVMECLKIGMRPE